MTAATPGSAELLALADQVERDGVTVYGPWHPYETVKQMIVGALRLAAKPDEDPDAMNDKRALEDARLAALRRLAIVQRHRMAYGGGTVHVGWTCKTCGNDWDRNEAEKHKPACVASPSTTGKPKP